MLYKKILILVLSILLLSSAACSNSSKPDEEKAKSASEPIVENVITSINSKDYAKFSRDFGSEMTKAFSEQSFKDLVKLFEEKIGSYTSKEYWRTEKSGNYTIVFYKAKYTKESGEVIVRSVLAEEDGKTKLSGIFFDSPNLRKK